MVLVSRTRRGFFRDFVHLAHRRAHAALMKKCRSADESVCPGMSAFSNRFEIDAPVHTNPILQVAFATPCVRLLYFRQGLVNELLPAESGIYRHDQQLIDLIEIGLDHGNCRGGIDRQPDLFTE